MSASVLTIQNAEKAKFTIIGEDRGGHAVQEVITAMRANRRSGTANSKTVAEVKHSKNKPWRQKGTGRARAGLTSSPIWRGGGVVFGPKPRDYSKKVPRKVRRLAFCRVVSDRIRNGDVQVIDSFSIESGKTRDFVAQRDQLTGEARTLIIGTKFDEMTLRAARNAESSLLITAGEVNTEHLLYYRKIVLTQDALKALAERSQTPEPKTRTAVRAA